MSAHVRPATVLPAARPPWLRGALLVALCAALCAGAMAVPRAAAAEAPGAFAWPEPWLFGTTDSSFVSDLVKAPDGSVYAAGNTGYGQSGSTAFVSRLRTTNGARIWRATRGGTYLAGAASDAARNVVLAGSTNGDIAVAKYRPNGKLAWARTWGGRGSIESALDVAVSSSGAVYVAGVRKASDASDKDAVVVAFSAGGRPLWRYIVATSGDDEAGAVTTDAAGAVYMTGHRAGGVLMVYKLTSAGKRVWVRTATFIRSNAKEFGSGQWLSVRGKAVYVVSQRGISTAGRLAAMKLSLAGAQRWFRTAYPLPGSALFSGAAVDAKGKLFIVGSVPGTPPAQLMGVVLATRADGRMAWHDEFEDPLGTFDTRFSGVAVDGADRPLCSGTMAMGASRKDWAAVVVRYGAGGGIEKIWRWEGDAGGDNGFGPLYYDGGLYVGGQVTVAAGTKALVDRLKQ